MRLYLAGLLALALVPTACSNGVTTPTPSPTSTRASASCPPLHDTRPATSLFTLKVRDASEQPLTGVKLSVSRTPRLPVQACPGGESDTLTPETDANGSASFYNLAKGTYTLKVDGKTTPPATFVFETDKSTYDVVVGADSTTVSRFTPLKARFSQSYSLAKAGLPVAGQGSFTIESAEAATAFRAWLTTPDPELADVDFSQERLVALYRTLLTPGCSANIVFFVRNGAIANRIDSNPPPGIMCAPTYLPPEPFWGVVALPVGSEPVTGTTVLTADATWLKTTPN